MRNIDSIDNDGKVLFVDDKGTGTTVGTKSDCLSYGFNYRNSKCYAYNTTVKPAADKNKSKGNVLKGNGNFAIGIGNKITSGINNVALGFKNLIHRNADNSVVIGKNAYAENFGEFAFSSSKISNRAKLSILQFDGITTNATQKEIYLGGHEGARLYINSNYETGFAIDYTAVALNEASNEVWTNYGHATYKYVNSVLTEVGHQKGTTIRDSALDYDLNFAPHTHDGVHISVDATGEAGHTAYWTVICRITEVRYG